MGCAVELRGQHKGVINPKTQQQKRDIASELVVEQAEVRAQAHARRITGPHNNEGDDGHEKVGVHGIKARQVDDKIDKDHHI